MEIRKFSKIPLNRIIALVLMDIMCIVVTSFGALYIRYEFSFQSIDPVFLQSYENIMVPNVLMTLSFFVIWKLYKSVWRYASANELINIIMAAVCASLAHGEQDAQELLCAVLLPADHGHLLHPVRLPDPAHHQ